VDEEVNQASFKLRTKKLLDQTVWPYVSTEVSGNNQRRYAGGKKLIPLRSETNCLQLVNGCHKI